MKKLMTGYAEQRDLREESWKMQYKNITITYEDAKIHARKDENECWEYRYPYSDSWEKDPEKLLAVRPTGNPEGMFYEILCIELFGNEIKGEMDWAGEGDNIRIVSPGAYEWEPAWNGIRFHSE
ncbi:hypothetical protein Mpet_0772 [Methanolacinia petrolearia DSM 11571]|uniref:Uncharacterized protein n=2 Tax=Methanolacinia TaxID=230355 RepID=E1RIV8_METP4|nr:hypothetical protein Mpet_0772 [Methanolacinia petrolearia DSM 11571]